MMSETNSALEFHGYGEELSCELTKDSDPELKACVERSAASWMQMRKREMRMLDILYDIISDSVRRYLQLQRVSFHAHCNQG